MPDPALPETETAARVCALVAETLAAQHPLRPLPEITPDSALDVDLHCDQIDRVCIACELDEAFGIWLPDAEMERWESVRDIIASVVALGP